MTTPDAPLHEPQGPATTQRRVWRSAARLLLVALLLTATRNASPEDEPPKGWQVGQRVETTLWRYTVLDELWDRGSDEPPGTRGQLQLHRIREEFECTEVAEGKPRAGRATYHEWCAFMPPGRLDACLQGATVHLALDGDGRVQWRVDDDRDVSEAAQGWLRVRSRELAPGGSRIAGIVKPARAPGDEPIGVEAAADLLVLPGVSSDLSTLTVFPADAEGWILFQGVLRPSGTDVWRKGGRCQIGGLWLERGGDAHLVSAGRLLGMVKGLRPDGRVNHLWTYHVVATRPLEAAKPPASAEAASSPPSESERRAWAAAQRSVVESTAVDADVPWRALLYDGAQRGPLLPAWLVRPGRSLCWSGADGTGGALVEPLAPGPRADVLAAPAAMAPAMPSTKPGVRSTLRAGERVHGFLPDGKGGVLVRRWTVGELRDVEDEPRPWLLGLADSDAARGAWLLTSEEGDVIGWTTRACAWGAADLVWADRVPDPASPGQPPVDVDKARQPAWSLPVLDVMGSWIPEDDQDPKVASNGEAKEALSPDSLLTAGRLHLGAGRVDEAHRAMQRLRTEWPTFDALLRSSLRVLNRALEDASPGYVEPAHLLRLRADVALLELPGRAQVLALAEDMRKSKRLRSALGLYKACITEGYAKSSGLHGAARVLLELELPREVVALLEPEPAARTDADLAVLLSDALVLLDQREEAQRVVEVIAEDRRDGQVLDRLVRFALKANDLVSMARYVQAWVKLEPTDATALYWTAYLPYKAERWAEALVLARAGLVHHPKDAFLLDLAASSAHGLDDKAETARFMARLEEVDADHATRLKNEFAAKPAGR